AGRPGRERARHHVREGALRGRAWRARRRRRLPARQPGRHRRGDAVELPGQRRLDVGVRATRLVGSSPREARGPADRDRPVHGLAVAQLAAVGWRPTYVATADRTPAAIATRPIHWMRTTKPTRGRGSNMIMTPIAIAARLRITLPRDRLLKRPVSPMTKAEMPSMRNSASATTIVLNRGFASTNRPARMLTMPPTRRQPQLFSRCHSAT